MGQEGGPDPGVLKHENTGAPNLRVPGRRGSWGQDSLALGAGES